MTESIIAWRRDTRRPGVAPTARGRDGARDGGIRSQGVREGEAARPGGPTHSSARPAPSAETGHGRESRPRAADPAEPLWRHVLGRRLRLLRHERGETLTETATRAGLSPQYLSEVERGVKEPSSEMIAAVAGALGVSLLDLTLAVARDLDAAGRAAVVELRGVVGARGPAGVRGADVVDLAGVRGADVVELASGPTSAPGLVGARDGGTYLLAA